MDTTLTPSSSIPAKGDDAVRSAGFCLRAIAAVLDLAILVGIVWGVGLLLIRTAQPVAAQDEMLLLYLTISAAYSIGFWLRCDATPGKLLLGLRVVRSRDLNSISLWQAVLRWCGYAPSLFIFGAGYLMAVFQPRKQTMHDLLASTRVIRFSSGRLGK